MHVLSPPILGMVAVRLAKYIITAQRSCPAFLNAKYPGLQDKMAWFYNEFVARSKTSNRRALYKRGVTKKIRRRFPGFAKLYKFRNDLSHGVVNGSAQSLAEAQQLRDQAKHIVSELFTILQKRGHDIPRDTTYNEAING